MVRFGILKTIMRLLNELSKGEQAMDYISFFEKKHIDYQDGLSAEELRVIEKIYDIAFPSDYREFLCQVVPTGRGFYQWRDFSEENIQYIKKVIDAPLTDIWLHASEVYWNDDWGVEPNNPKQIETFVREQLVKAPRLIPIYSHRYVPMCNGDRNPVFSVCGTDVVYYAEDIEDYFKTEYGDKPRHSLVMPNLKRIPVWTELALM